MMQTQDSFVITHAPDGAPVMLYARDESNAKVTLFFSKEMAEAFGKAFDTALKQLRNTPYVAPTLTVPADTNGNGGKR